MATTDRPCHLDVGLRALDVSASSHRRLVLVQWRAQSFGLAGLLAPMVDRRTQCLASPRRDLAQCPAQLVGSGSPHHAGGNPDRHHSGYRPGPMAVPDGQRRQLVDAGPARHPRDRDGRLATVGLHEPVHRNSAGTTSPVAWPCDLLHLVRGGGGPRSTLVDRAGLRGGGSRPRR